MVKIEQIFSYYHKKCIRLTRILGSQNFLNTFLNFIHYITCILIQSTVLWEEGPSKGKRSSLEVLKIFCMKFYLDCRAKNPLARQCNRFGLDQVIYYLDDGLLANCIQNLWSMLILPSKVLLKGFVILSNALWSNNTYFKFDKSNIVLITNHIDHFKNNNINLWRNGNFLIHSAMWRVWASNSSSRSLFYTPLGYNVCQFSKWFPTRLLAHSICWAEDLENKEKKSWKRWQKMWHKYRQSTFKSFYVYISFLDTWKK